MKAFIAGSLMCRCGMILQPNLDNELMCVNPKCGGYEIRYELPTVELKPVEKKE